MNQVRPMSEPSHMQSAQSNISLTAFVYVC